MSDVKEKSDNNDFLELCKYIETEILNYKPNQKLQKAAVLRIRGLSKGQVIANNNQQQFGEYPYKIILMTFKLYKNQILNSIIGKSFESETNKIAYITAIVRDKINDVYSRYLNAKKSEEKIDNVNTDIMTYEGAEYKKQDNNESNSNKFDDLW